MVFIFCCILFVYISIKTKKGVWTLKKFQKFFFHKILAKILLDCGNALFLWLQNSKCYFFFILADPSKSALLTQYFNYLKALLVAKKGSIGRKKFHRFWKWGQMWSTTYK